MTNQFQILEDKLNELNMLPRYSAADMNKWTEDMKAWQDSEGILPPPAHPYTRSENEILKPIQFTPKEIKLLLTPQAYELVITPVMSTVIEQDEPDEYGTEDTPMKREVYFVQYFGLLIKGDVTVKIMRRFCGFINEMVRNGDIFIGTLSGGISAMPIMTDLEGNKRTMLLFYPVARISKDELNKKYHYFNTEGEMPKEYADK